MENDKVEIIFRATLLFMFLGMFGVLVGMSLKDPFQKSSDTSVVHGVMNTVQPM